VVNNQNVQAFAQFKARHQTLEEKDMSNYKDRPSRLSNEEVFVIFGVVNKRGGTKEAQEIIHKKLRLPRPHRTTIARVFNVSVELFKRSPNDSALTEQEVEEIATKAGYNTSRSRVVALHRLHQLWKIRRPKETGELGSDATPQLKQELRSVPHDKVTLNTYFAGAIPGINWEAEPYFFVPAEADDVMSALFRTLTDEDSQEFNCDPKVENQLTEELRGKIIFFPLPADKAVNYLECRKVLNEHCLSEQGIQALREEADRVR
jgi:hypothetical protein